VRQRLLEQLAQALLGGDPPGTVQALAERAGWPVPDAVTAVLVPEGDGDRVRIVLPQGTLQTARAPRGREPLPPVETLLVPGGAATRRRVLRALRSDAVVGPTVAWDRTPVSAERAGRVLLLRRRELVAGTQDGRVGTGDAGGEGRAGSGGWGVVDTDAHLVELALTADEAVVADLRDQVLGPLQELRPAAVDKLTATLRAWLLHQGRRDDVAGALYVHPQTVRYRMGQLRELYGDLLDDPDWVLRATLALAVPPAAAPAAASTGPPAAP
jgi:hypothetical protein